eukprot:gb/GECH01004864.1/.p1 GENE.gb/GECH01004864.1/~~gb/GECH01004864.1/.p1  ORF type:complete len:135 (+),score=22.53 gb/GECH01004864.1/:1-405(+)
MVKSNKAPYSLITRRVFANPLLNRRQFVIDVRHQGKACPTKSEIQKKVAKMYKVRNGKTIFLRDFDTKFGGGHTTGFGMIYDTLDDAKRVEPRYMLARHNLAEMKKMSRKPKKERKNRAKKHRGKKKASILQGK